MKQCYGVIHGTAIFMKKGEDIMNYKRFFKASDIQKIEADWLWDPYIPRGKITMVHGEEGTGKTMFGIMLMAACTNKVRMDLYGDYLDRCNCLYMTKEENLPAVLRPKLEEAGADLDKILVINDHLPITLSDDSIREIIEENQVGLLVIDPISAYISEKEDFFECPHEVMPVILMLEKIAADTGCAIVLIDKSDGMESMQSKAWRLGFESHISSYLCLEWEDDCEYEERMLYHEYSNLSMEGDSILYAFTQGKGLKACG